MAKEPSASRHSGAGLFASIVTGLGKDLTWFRWWLESKLLIMPVEGLARLWYHLDPRLYVRRFRISRVTEGLAVKKSGKYAIFVLYARSTLPSFTVNLIDAVARTPFNLIIVSNIELDPLQRAQLQEQCHILIERANLGRDFGAYKDGIEYILEHDKDVERVLLVNDSLFFFSRGLDKLLADFDGPQEFIGTTEVLEFHYHVQSFMLSFGRNVLRNRHFLKYWRKYRPVSTRRWSIHKGEVNLTRRLTRAGFRPHILFQAAQLTPHLQRRAVRDVLESVRLFPDSFRRRLYQQFDEIVGEGGRKDSLAALETISQGVRTLPASRGDDRSKLGRISGQAVTMEKWNFEILTNKIVSTIADRNQVHVGGFFFMKYLGLPIIKRDIFFREIYALEEVHRILTDLNEPLRDEVLSDLRRGGTGKHISGFRRILYRHGSI
jgi:hypothetical protein